MTSAQSVAPIGRNPGPMKNQCRRLHDTKIAPAGGTSANTLEQYTSFRARFISRSNKDSLRELHGFYFSIDGKVCIYDYRSFGKKNYNRSISLILERKTYSYCHGRRKGENYTERDIRPGVTLSFTRSSGRFPLESGQKDQVVFVRVTEVDEYVAKAFDPWWGIPTGGARTEEERNARQILSKVQTDVKGGPTGN